MPVLPEDADENTEINQPWMWKKWWPTSKQVEEIWKKINYIF